MGRKHEIVEEDPILKKNHRIEKRRKARQQQRAELLQQQSQDRKRMEELALAKKMVLEEEALLIERTNRAIPKERGLFSRLSQQEKPLNRVIRVQDKLKQLVVSEGEIDDIASYEHHFSDLDERILVKTAKHAQVDSTKLVKDELRQLFGKEPIEVPKVQLVGEENCEEELAPQLKRLSNVLLKGREYCCNNLFERRLSNVNYQNGMIETMMRSYRDYVFVQNKEEQTIGEFRKHFVQHILRHLQICGARDKSKGFTNPKILVLTPFMGDARALIDLIVEAVGLPQQNRERIDEIDDETDMFRVSMTISQRNKKVKFFANFNHAHIIISSPLGLRTIVGAEGEEKRDFSFLSSVEVVLIERAQVILMQNWLHLLQIMQSLNKMPQYESMVNPIQSIRDNFLKERGRFYRQNLVFTEFGFPQLNALAKRHFSNREGLLQDIHYYPGLRFEQKFHQQFLKLDTPSIDRDLDVRLDFFRRKLWSKMVGDELLERYLIFTSSYFEFVKLKSFFEKVNAPAEFISEHTKKPKVQSRISRFNSREFRFMVITQRAYYFEVCQIKRIEHVLFYSLPRNSWIYRRLVESLVEPKTELPGPSNLNSVTSICSRYDIQALQRIVGTVDSQEMLSDSNKSGSMIV